MTAPLDLSRLTATLDEWEAKAKAATPGEWFSIGQPWNDGAGYVNAGNADPHGGRMVCDCACQCDSETGDINDERNDWNDADHIAATNPQAVLSMIAQVRQLIGAVTDFRMELSNAACEMAGNECGKCLDAHERILRVLSKHRGITDAAPNTEEAK